MTLKERWNAEESKVGKFLKYVLGYCSTVAGVVTDLTVNYLPALGQYVPMGMATALVKIGVAAYIIGKLTVKPKPIEQK